MGGSTEKSTFLPKKKHKKALFRKIPEKKATSVEKKHKKAHVLFKSTLYDPWIITYIALVPRILPSVCQILSLQVPPFSYVHQVWLCSASHFSASR